MSISVEQSMSRRSVTISVDNRFVEAIDQAVLRARRTNPESYISRSGFMKTAIRRAIADLGAHEEPKIRTRQRIGSAA